MQLELLWFKVLIHALCVVIVEPFNRMFVPVCTQIFLPKIFNFFGLTSLSCGISYGMLWKEVEKAVNPAFKEMENPEGETPYVLFATNHENLRKEGEKWMMNTARSCIWWLLH